MKVSVVVPNYNHSKYLKQRIDSILDQTYRDFELIVLDDSSNDGSRMIIDEYVSKYPIIHFYNNSNSGSAFRQWDFGIRKAKGEYIWIAESDDFARPDFLERSVPVLEKNMNAGLVYCDSKIIDEINNVVYLASDYKNKMYAGRWSFDYVNNGIDELSNYLYLNNTINNVSGVLFRKSKYIEAGFADHDMYFCGDWYLYIRMMLYCDIAYLSAPLNSIRLHSGSTFNQYFKKSNYFLEVLRIYKFTASKIGLSLRRKTAVAKILCLIIIKRILNGNIPEFRDAVKILTARS